MAGVYIKGMEMPGSCEECRFWDGQNNGCPIVHMITLRRTHQKKPDWCPLVEVPDHGDLIANKDVIGMEKLKFLLNGCDISFIAEVPEDITLKQLLKQCDKIEPDWCACGICSLSEAWFNEDEPVEIMIDYDTIKKCNEAVTCKIKEEV